MEHSCLVRNDGKLMFGVAT